MLNPVIVFDHFSFRYESQQEDTLHDINLTIYKGQKVLILGQSGSGKSTLIHCINGLIPNSYPGIITGQCEVAGMDTKHASIFSLSKQVGTVLQDSDAQFVALSVEEDVAFALENQAIPRNEMIQRVRLATDKVGMTDFLKQVPFTLSGGQKQKVSLAGVLHEKVGILLFDEPLASLDPHSGMQAIELIDQIHNEDRTIIIVEHRLEEVMYRSIDRVIVMHLGSIVYDGKLDDLLRARILFQYGLREPLYLQALQIAKVHITKLDPIDNIKKLNLDNEKNKLVVFNQAVHESNMKFDEVILEVDHISFAYDEIDVIQDVSFKIYKGERVAFVGKNGAGKSTMAKLICGFERTNKGQIKLHNQDTLALTIREIGERIGFVMQNPNQMLVKHLIKEEVTFALIQCRVKSEEIEERVNEALKICGLYSMRNWPVSAVSYGQRKRLTVAAILALKPDILILDEPSAGQDYTHYSEIMDFLDNLNKNQGITFIFITHDMHLAIEYTDRAIVFSDAKIIADDSIHAIMSDPFIIEQANLKQTSLYDLAKICDYSAESVIQYFIDHRRDI
jgi:energy-coupling factor transport system ATP-binding protein